MEYINIKNVKIKKTAALAPMASVADRAFRQIAKEFGAAYCVGEMASCKGLVYSDRKTAELLTVTEIERPMAVQLFGSEPEFFAPAVKIAEGFKPDIIDINCGCPVPKVAGNGSGSALMKNPKLFGGIVSAAVKAAKVPVTVKIRKGWDESSVNAVEIARIAEECGASASAMKLFQHKGQLCALVRAGKKQLCVSNENLFSYAAVNPAVCRGGAAGTAAG